MTAKKIKQATVAEPTTTGNLSKLPFIFFVWTSFKEENIRHWRKFLAQSKMAYLCLYELLKAKQKWV